MRRNLRDLVELFLLPGLLALLPSRVRWPLARWVCRWERLYASEAVSALNHARPYINVADEAAWKAAHRLTRLVDHLDLYLWLWRREGWLARHLRVQGAWPVKQAFLAIGFHWGNGLWTLKHLHDATGRFAGVAAAPQRSHFAGRPFLYRYAVLRTRETAKLVQGGLSFTGNAALHLSRALKSGVTICGLFDVLPPAGEKALRGRLLERDVAMPRGFPRLAVHYGVPIVCFHCTVDAASGDTVLVIDPPQTFAHDQEACTYLLGRLQSLLQREPAGWHHWPVMPQFEAAAQTSREAVPDH